MREFRFTEGIEVRQRSGRPVLRGYAARFNSLSRPLGGFVEKIAPGAFRNSIRGDVRALVNHDPSKLLGRTVSGTLSLREDENGLYCEINPPDTSAGRDVIESVKRGDLDGMSFGFVVPAGGDVWSTTPDGRQLRELREVTLSDVSIATYPAYESTSVALRALFPDGVPQSVRDALVGGDSPTGGSVIDTGAALAALKKAMKIHSLLLPDLPGRVELLGGHLKAALKALGGGVTDAGGLDDSHAGDDKTQLPSRSYSWMSPELQRFYKRQDRLQRMNKRQDEFEAMVLRTAPDSTTARMLKNDRQLAEIAQDQARDDARAEKAEHHDRWRLKDDYAVVPLWRDPECYPRKKREKPPVKDPWVAS